MVWGVCTHKEKQLRRVEPRARRKSVRLQLHRARRGRAPRGPSGAAEARREGERRLCEVAMMMIMLHEFDSKFLRRENVALYEHNEGRTRSPIRDRI